MVAGMSRTDTASRHVPAPPERVYVALTDPAALVDWLPPDGMRGRFDWFDLRPGGSYRMVLTHLDARAVPGKSMADADIVDARFVDLVPGERIVQAVDFVADDPAFAGTMTLTWEVSAADGGSRVEIRADDVPSGVDPGAHAAGMASSLANLAAHLAR